MTAGGAGPAVRRCAELKKSDAAKEAKNHELAKLPVRTASWTLRAHDNGIVGALPCACLCVSGRHGIACIPPRSSVSVSVSVSVSSS